MLHYEIVNSDELMYNYHFTVVASGGGPSFKYSTQFCPVCGWTPQKIYNLNLGWDEIINGTRKKKKSSVTQFLFAFLQLFL